MSTVQANPSTDDDGFNQAFEEVIGAIAIQRHIHVMRTERDNPRLNNLMRMRLKLNDPAFVSQLSNEEIETLRKDVVDSAIRGKAQFCVRTSLNSVTEERPDDYAGVTVEVPEGLLDPSKAPQTSLDGIMKDAWDKFNRSLIHLNFGPRDQKQSMRWRLVDCTSGAITSHVVDVEDGARITKFRESLASLPIAEVWEWCKTEEALGLAAWKAENKIKTGDPSEVITASSQIPRHPMTLEDVEAENERLSEDLPDFKPESLRRYKEHVSNDIYPENLTRLETAFREAWDDGTVNHETWRSTFDLGTILLDRKMIDAATGESDQPVHEDRLTLAAVPSKITLADAWPDDRPKSQESDVVDNDEWVVITEE